MIGQINDAAFTDGAGRSGTLRKPALAIRATAVGRSIRRQLRTSQCPSRDMASAERVIPAPITQTAVLPYCSRRLLGENISCCSRLRACFNSSNRRRRESACYPHSVRKRITSIEMEVAKALREFMAIAESDIREAHGQLTKRRAPSARAMAVYAETVRLAEAFADTSN
jgi:hypothetical protein